MEGRITLSNAKLWLCWLAHLGRSGQKIYRTLAEVCRETPSGVKLETRWCQEKLLNVEMTLPVPQTDTGVRV